MPQLVFIILCILGYAVASAQSDYLVLTAGDTLYGKVVHLSYGSEHKVQLTEPGKKKVVYSTMQVRSFRMKDDTYHLLKLYNRYMFMRLITPGYLSLYSFQPDNQANWDGRYLHKLDGQGIEVPNIGFKKRMTDYLSDCPEVAEQISEGNLSRNDLDDIINQYNLCIDQHTSSRQQEIPEKAKDEVPVEKLNPWSELESAIKATESLTDKESILEMITEAKLKVGRGEKLPNFLIEGLKKSLAQKSDLSELLEKALKENKE